jgi:Fe-S oxidoreductase
VEPDHRRIPEPEAAFSISVELARGCPYSCLFCMESYITKPYRPRDWRIVLDEATRLFLKHGVRPSIVALTANAHPGFKQLLAEAVERGLRLSLPSLRAELLDDETIELLAAVGQRTLTIAPESSERLRKALGKDVSNEDVLKAARKAHELGMKLKLYIMVGLPCERQEDLEEVTSLVKELRKTTPAVSLSVNPFIPKPQTPLQYSAMAPVEYIQEKIDMLKKAHRGEFSFYDPLLGVVQAAIALGGREVARHIEAAALSSSPLGYWKKALRSGELNYVFKSRDEPLPWSHVRGFYPPEELRRRYHSFLEKACGEG